MLKLILADNQAIFRAGIAKVLAVEDEMRIVAQAQTPEQIQHLKETISFCEDLEMVNETIEKIHSDALKTFLQTALNAWLKLENSKIGDKIKTKMN